MCGWGCSAYRNGLPPDGKWDDGKARMRKQLMRLQIATRKANVSTNAISEIRQWGTCQSQLLGMGKEATKISSKYARHKHKYKCVTLLRKCSMPSRSGILALSCHPCPLLPPSLPSPALAHRQRDHRPPTAPGEEMGSPLIAPKRKHRR